jgi:quercetin dioxygenase-like cupin family protein
VSPAQPIVSDVRASTGRPAVLYPLRRKGGDRERLKQMSVHLVATNRGSGVSERQRAVFAQEGTNWKNERTVTSMEITRNSIETGRGPSDWFTGTVYIDPIAAMAPLGAAAVHFTPGARTAWHTHPRGQTIWVTEGIGLCQKEGGPVEVIRPGDRVFFEPGENHWHGAVLNRLMTHIALQLADESGSPVTWGAHVSDEQYGQAPDVTEVSG